MRDRENFFEVAGGYNGKGPRQKDYEANIKKAYGEAKELLKEHSSIDV